MISSSFRFFSKSLLIIAVSSLSLLAASCYDDTEIKDRLEQYEARLQALEKLCNEMNTNIASLQQIVAALQDNDFVTGIAPVTENGTEIGYTITFSKSGSITIYHGHDGADGQNGKDGADGQDGKDGIDGNTPIVGLQQDTDGIWYWTLNGEWLLDAQGNKVKAVGIDGADGKDGENGQDGENGKDGTDGQDGKDGQNGKDGQDGVTPQLKIENDYWFISYDGGETWTQLGKATGENGKDGKDGKDGQDGKDGADGKDGYDGANGTSFFRSVTQDDDHVYLTLSNGTVITLPKTQPLDVTFKTGEETLTGLTLSVSADETLDIQYVISSEATEVKVEVITSSDIKATILPADMLTGTLRIHVGAAVDEYSKATFIISDGVTLLMKTFTFSNANS